MRELFFAYCLLGRGLVLRLHPASGLIGGELAQLDNLGAGGSGTVAPLFRVPRCAALPALGRDELCGGIVAENAAGKALRFERVSFVSGV